MKRLAASQPPSPFSAAVNVSQLLVNRTRYCPLPLSPFLSDNICIYSAARSTTWAGHVWQWLNLFQQCYTVSDSDCFLDIIQFSDCVHGVTKQSYATHGHMLNPKHTHMFTIHFVLLMFMLFTLCHHHRCQCRQTNHNLWLSLWLVIILIIIVISNYLILRLCQDVTM